MGIKRPLAGRAFRPKSRPSKPPIFGYIAFRRARRACWEPGTTRTSQNHQKAKFRRIHIPRTPLHKDIKKGAEALSRPGPFQMLLVYESRSLRSPFFCLALPFL
jgi:hypothetical protein